MACPISVTTSHPGDDSVLNGMPPPPPLVSGGVDSVSKFLFFLISFLAKVSIVGRRVSSLALTLSGPQALFPVAHPRVPVEKEETSERADVWTPCL